MFRRGDQCQEGMRRFAPTRDRVGSNIDQLSLPSLSSPPSLDETKAAGLIRIADTAKRLELHPISNLIFAHVADALGQELPGKLFIEQRTVQGYLRGKHHRYYDLFSLQLSEPHAYLCIPYPLIHPAVARHFEAIARPTPEVIHARKFPWTSAHQRNVETTKLARGLFSYFPEDNDLTALVSTAGKMLEYWESKKCVRELHTVAREFFKGRLPAPLRSL